MDNELNADDEAELRDSRFAFVGGEPGSDGAPAAATTNGFRGALNKRSWPLLDDKDVEGNTQPGY